MKDYLIGSGLALAGLAFAYFIGSMVFWLFGAGPFISVGVDTFVVEKLKWLWQDPDVIPFILRRVGLGAVMMLFVVFVTTRPPRNN